MRIRAGYRIDYDCPAPTPMLLMLNVRPEREDDLETPDRLVTSPAVAWRTYRDVFGNICTRLVAPAGGIHLESEFVIRDSGLPDPAFPDADQAAVEALPDEVIQFLLPSRYCDTEPLTDLAWAEFGQVRPGWARVQAIVAYAHERIAFSYDAASPTRTASQGHEGRLGVCRDYAHLAVALCRCLNIPARYCTGYLGDIGVEAAPFPMDMSAWFEAWIGGAWRTFDARHNAPRIGRIMIGAGRDAADVAMVTTFGPATFKTFEVITEEV